MVTENSSTPFTLGKFLSSHQQFVASKDPKALLSAMRLTSRVFLLKALIEAFALSPKRALSGKPGVADLLRLSRTAVRNRIKNLGLTIKDFQRPNVALEDLFEKSSVLPGELEQLSRLFGR